MNNNYSITSTLMNLPQVGEFLSLLNQAVLWINVVDHNEVAAFDEWRYPRYNNQLGEGIEEALEEFSGYLWYGSQSKLFEVLAYEAESVGERFGEKYVMRHWMGGFLTDRSPSRHGAIPSLQPADIDSVRTMARRWFSDAVSAEGSDASRLERQRDTIEHLLDRVAERGAQVLEDSVVMLDLGDVWLALADNILEKEVPGAERSARTEVMIRIHNAYLEAWGRGEFGFGDTYGAEHNFVEEMAQRLKQEARLHAAA